MQASENYDIHLSWDGKVIDALVDCYDVYRGARSFKQEVRCELPSGRCVYSGTTLVPLYYVFFPFSKADNVGDLKFPRANFFLLLIDF